MGITTVAEDLVRAEELEDMYKLTATETDPEDEDEEDEADEEGEEEEPGPRPGVMPQG